MSPQPPRKILIVRLGALGDILHALPAQQHLARALPDAEIHWLCEPAYVPLLEASPGITRVWTADTKAWRKSPLLGRQLFSLVRRMRRVRFDTVFDFQGLVKSALLARLSGARRRIGFHPERFKESGIQWLYSETSPGESDLGRHVIEVNMDLVSRIAPSTVADAVVQLAIPPGDVATVRRHLRENQARRPVLINPGAGWVTKLWPVENYARLGLEIEKRTGHPAVYTYGPGEEGLIAKVGEVWGAKTVRAFPTTLLQLAALCRESRLMIAGDSGPLHLAVAVGTPAVAVLGPTNARRNGPFNPHDLVVKRDLPCSDSYRRVCDQFICMDIPVEQVLEAALRRLESSAPHLETIASTAPSA